MEIESDRSKFIDSDPVVVPVNPVGPAPRVVTPVSGGAAFLPADQVPLAVSAQPVVAQQVVTHPVAAVAETRRMSSSAIVSPAAIIAGIVAIALLILGGITVARAGVDGGIDQPVEVAGFSATALLGFIELGFGALLLIAALSRARASIMFFGIVGTVAAVVAVFQPTVGNGSLALERGFAVLMTIAMLVVTLAAFLPTIRRSTSTVERLV